MTFDKEEALSEIIDLIRKEKPAAISPIVDKIMAAKVKEIIKEKQNKISKGF